MQTILLIIKLKDYVVYSFIMPYKCHNQLKFGIYHTYYRGFADELLLLKIGVYDSLDRAN